MHRCPTSKCVLFLSTPSARRATGIIIGCPEGQEISIHALREEGDVSSCSSSGNLSRFLSTPSARRATLMILAASKNSTISIHALREEGDLCTA